MLSMMTKKSADDILKKFCYYYYFPGNIGSDVSCKLSPLEAVRLKCQNPVFWGKMKNIISLSSAEFAKRVVRIYVCEDRTQL